MAFGRNRASIFYGWWIVGASFVIALYAGGVIFYGFTAFFEPIARDMGWSYTQVSLAASLRGMEMGILSPFIGVLVDRLGPRKVIFSGGTATAMGLAVLSATTSLPMFYAAFGLMAIGMSACTMTVLMTAIANWFRRKIGTATGLAICGFGFSGLLVPLIAQLISTYEWRTAALILAVGMAVIVLPLSFVFRHKPEDYGYLADGQTRAAAYAESQAAVQPIEVDARAREAVRSTVFWRLGLCYMYHMLVVNATVTHVMPYLSSVGVSTSLSSLIAMGIPLASVAGRLGLGWLGDKHDKRVVAAVGFAIMGLGMLCFGHASAASTWVLVPFLALLGVGYGGGNVLRPSLVREYFGRANFGAVFGLMMGIGAVGAIAGPTLAGWAYDNWGAYQGVWYLLAGLALVAVALVLSIPQPEAD